MCFTVQADRCFQIHVVLSICMPNSRNPTKHILCSCLAHTFAKLQKYIWDYTYIHIYIWITAFWPRKSEMPKEHWMDQLCRHFPEYNVLTAYAHVDVLFVWKTVDISVCKRSCKKVLTKWTVFFLIIHIKTEGICAHERKETRAQTLISGHNGLWELTNFHRWVCTTRNWKLIKKSNCYLFQVGWKIIFLVLCLFLVSTRCSMVMFTILYLSGSSR